MIMKKKIKKRMIAFIQWYNPELEKENAKELVEYFENAGNIKAGYYHSDAIKIIDKYDNIKNIWDKFQYINKQKGIELIISDNRYWFEYFGKQITPTDFYVGTIKTMLETIFKN